MAFKDDRDDAAVVAMQDPVTESTAVTIDFERTFRVNGGLKNGLVLCVELWACTHLTGCLSLQSSHGTTKVFGHCIVS